jgi:zinc transport system substrate-binding protein
MALRFFFIGAFFACMFLFHCGKENAASSAMPLFVSILPQKSIVEKVGGTFVDVSVMVQPGSSPHSYEPRPVQMTALSKARAYFSIGLEFEKVWLPKFSGLNSAMSIIPMDSGIAKRPLDMGCEHGGNPARDRPDYAQHAGFDPHIWLSPELLKKQGMTVCEALCRIDPVHSSMYLANRTSFVSELTVLQDSIRTILNVKDSLQQHKTFMVFHPSWGYFADEFHLRQVAIEIEGKEPSAKQLQMIMETARSAGVRTIFVQPQFSQRSADIIARQLGGRVKIADDLAADVCGNLLAFAKALALQ